MISKTNRRGSLTPSPTILFFSLKQDDAIAGSSGNLSIQYFDTKTGIDIYGYNNIIGVDILTYISAMQFGVIMMTHEMTRVEQGVMKYPRYKAFYTVHYSSEAIGIVSDIELDIRVFYLSTN